MMTNITNRPGYVEAFTANSSELAKFEPGQPQFHWNVVNSIRRFIKESEGEAKGWRQQVTTLIAEKSWLKLEYASLPELVKDAFGMTSEDFLHEVEVYGGPAMVDLVSPHLGLRQCNNDDSPLNGAQRQSNYEQRQAANAPEIAIRLRASDLITEADMRYLGKLNTDDAHQETLQLIEDRLVELGQPDGSTETDRRRYRAKVKDVIQAVAPKPEPQKQSKVLRFPNDAERALAIIQEHLSKPEQLKLRQMICDGIEPPPKKAKSPNQDVLPTLEEAQNNVLSLKEGDLARGKDVYILIGYEKKFATFQANCRKAAVNNEHAIFEGNGWKFRKLTTKEMQDRGLHDKRSSYEVLEYGNI